MAQNIYDDPGFFAGYSRMTRSIEGLDGAPEWPALRALLPPLRGLRVLDLGCGFGWFCRFARDNGAARILGIDLSQNMLARARTMTDDPAVEDRAVEYRRTDLERLDLPAASFDLAYSSLALHYVEDLAGLFAGLHRALAPNARLVFSMEHPIYTAPSNPGWSVDAQGRKTWPIDSYLIEGPRKTNWLAEGVVKRHRTIGTTLNLLIRAGFTISHVEEWVPSEAQIADSPDLAEERERPMFLLVAAEQ